MSQAPLRCLITGANTGIGFEVARQLLQRGHEVIIACRDTQRGQQAVEKLQQQQRPRSSSEATSASASAAVVSAVACDLASFASVHSCAAAVRQQWPQFDVLVCNAAVIPSRSKRTADGIDEQLQVNHLSHFLLVHLLLPCLVEAADQRAAAAAATVQQANHQQQQQHRGPASSRIVVVGSLQHNKVPEEYEDPASLQPFFGPIPAAAAAAVDSTKQDLTPMQLYAVTKICNIWFTRYLSSHILPATGGKVVANVVSPGFIPNTDLGRHMAGNWLSKIVMKYIMPWAPFAVTLQEGAGRVAALCDGVQQGAVTGRFFSRRQITLPSVAAQDPAKAALLWNMSCKAVGIDVDDYGSLDSSSVSAAHAAGLQQLMASWLP